MEAIHLSFMRVRLSLPKLSCLGLFLAVEILAPSLSWGQSVAWTRQLGGTGYDIFWDVSADNLGNVFAVGQTSSNLFAPPNANDALIVKYDSSGNLIAGFQDGSSGNAVLVGAAADGTGGVYVSGNTGGTLGLPNTTNGPAVHGHSVSSSTWNWLQQNTYYDQVNGSGGEGSGNIITVGFTSANGNDAAVQVRNSTGSVVWQDQFGSPVHDAALGTATDFLGNYFVTGITFGDLDGTQVGQGDMFLAKYDSAGSQQWVKQLGTSDQDYGRSVTTDAAGNIYVGGITNGAIGGPNLGSSDNFLAKYDPSGNLQWTKQYGSAAPEAEPYVVSDGTSTWLASSTYGSVAGPNQGDLDWFVLKLDPAGNVSWSKQLGSSTGDQAFGIAYALSRVYVVGVSVGNLGGTHQGDHDAVLIAITPFSSIPEPNSAMLIASAIAIVAAKRWGRARR